MLKIMTVYGTRPEAIKLAPVLEALAGEPDVTSVPVVTGQHREMLDQVNELFGIVPRHDLDIIQPGQTLAGITARIMERFDPVLAEEAPHAVVVQGDTTTSTAAALAAFYRGVPVVHVEAGLRSGDLAAPFPEEANRRLTSQLTTLHLAPTARSRANLLREGIDPDTVVVTGNTVIDALLATAARPVPPADPRLADLVAAEAPILLVTSHRRESWGAAMAGVGRALARISAAHPELTVVLPVHRNPVVREALVPMLAGRPNVIITEPLSYAEFATVLAAAHIVLTDSGGIQEEAPSLGKPVLVMRDNTERPEAVEAGTVRLIGTDENRVVKEVERLYLDPAAHAALAHAVNPYGDGRATARSVAAVRSLFGLGSRLPDFSG
ncbi:non-hydrolyzing UDP-N-acetylglucosamine 2-epimerase [Jiangella rhizosphaerae]|uniref:UDP-N-acetylglucosamine 2-epimerase (non-hydrolyzing) n=1 Tax=Jiangella rhizosphaerae TaxID=2293569 RepID=A0A418KSU5_9ACTN|nr:UDP-N-acetylglucosamine 2-epimerase (non-hydrolyzing) [Jiangella rhizosphaerae]RIQ28197.1 UDP-N-acetylglucosamine 2-epimerase (non-hydrolyzing) [Jiangella rhizosphaerae]